MMIVRRRDAVSSLLEASERVWLDREDEVGVSAEEPDESDALLEGSVAVEAVTLLVERAVLDGCAGKVVGWEKPGEVHALPDDAMGTVTLTGCNECVGAAGGSGPAGASKSWLLLILAT